MIETFGHDPKTHVAGVCEVVRTEMITPRMRRITLHGVALTGLERYWRPEMLIRLYFPPKVEKSAKMTTFRRSKMTTPVPD